jgi:hypothetical protein
VTGRVLAGRVGRLVARRSRGTRCRVQASGGGQRRARGGEKREGRRVAAVVQGEEPGAAAGLGQGQGRRLLSWALVGFRVRVRLGFSFFPFLFPFLNSKYIFK